MKALSLRQPWADLVVLGRKTLELRSWTVSYRGPIAIHASQTINDAACRENGIDPKTLTTGAIVGIVDLVDIIPIDAAAFHERRAEHLAGGFFEPPLYGWVIANPRSVDPVIFSGKMGLFNIPDEKLGVQQFSSTGLLVETSEAKTQQAVPPELDEETRLATHPFELRVVPENEMTAGATSYRLSVYQRVVQAPQAQHTLADTAPARMRQIVDLGGSLLRAVADAVLETLRANGYAATDLGTKRREPFRLNEESGVRLALIFLAVRPVSKMARVEDISRGIRAMTREELYYWFSKCTSGAHAERAQKALRNLLADE